MRERVLRKLRSWWRRVVPRGPRVETVGRARLAVDPEVAPAVRDWHDRVAALLRDALASSGAPLDVVVGDADPGWPHARRVGLQWEHTLVAPGGRDSDGAPAGGVPLADGSGRYLARVVDRARLEAGDAIVDYSRPNLEHLRRAGGFDAYLAKAVVVAPLVYATDTAPRPRRRAAITLFADTAQPRRRAFLDAARAAQVPLANVRGVYASDALRALYRDVRVVVNVHQTAQHHTFEELRVLPALLCGAVVVSEDVPLRESVPYHEFVIWARYDDLVETTREVLADHERVRERLFGDGRFATLVARMRDDDRAAVDELVRRFVGARPTA